MKKIFFIFFVFFLYYPLTKAKSLSPCKEKDVVKDNCYGSIEYKVNKDVINYVGNFKDNKPHGEGVYTYYVKGKDYPFGVVRYRGSSNFGVFNGKFKITYQDNSYDLAEYKNNQLHGKQLSYDMMHRLMAEQTFENGMIRSEIRFFYGPNVIKEESTFDSSEKLITTKRYFRDGRILTFKGDQIQEQFRSANLVKPDRETTGKTSQQNQNVNEKSSINKTLQKILNK